MDNDNQNISDQPPRHSGTGTKDPKNFGTNREMARWAGKKSARVSEQSFANNKELAREAGKLGAQRRWQAYREKQMAENAVRGNASRKRKTTAAKSGDAKPTGTIASGEAITKGDS